MENNQTIFGFGNKQEITQLIVDDKYLNRLISLPNNPADLNKLVLHIYNDIVDNENQFEKRSLPPDIDDKLDFNNVLTYRFLIESNYSENAYYLENAYESLNSETPGRKKVFLNYINSLYLQALGGLLKENPKMKKMEIINQFADTIISNVISSLLISISTNTKDIAHLSAESINLNVFTIVCHAFVDCKVLENPNN
ncbi:hypothetical protein NAT51_09240 [Flavobacterium amniphilum]|uniref:hypothetical protein n=1 Tax=Flavobacterium amniphilum TaxID=1834035 RepID=UPI00202A444A|nr:hypothetical protein [Flavobacterium amniphilum]MCL9805706.1 hypothetical protein [Flavobacterium amniphilum]